MKIRITAIFLSLVCSLSAQNPTADSIYRYNPWHILQGFHYSDYQRTDIYKLTGEYPFQWFAHTINGIHYLTQNIAINIVCTRDELDVLMAHKWKLVKDLYNMFMEAPVESFELSQIAGQRFELHRPGQTYPMYRYFKIIPSEGHCDHGELENGWHVRLIEGGVPGAGGKTPIALKETKAINGERTWLVSVALFMKIYYGDLLEP